MDEEYGAESFGIEYTPQMPFDFMPQSYCYFGMYLQPMEFEGWITEHQSWKKTAYIHAGLSCALPHSIITGPDVIRLLSDVSVNRFDNFEVGRAKHVIMCSEKGNVIEHGMAFRIAEDAVRTVDLDPYLSWKAMTGGYDVEIEDVMLDMFIYQIAGPKSLEIVENACEQDFHDLKFMRFVDAQIAGHPVKVLRMGMGGTISYEVHGMTVDSADVYGKLLEVGENYGLVRMGTLTYISQHTENGFPQQGGHFPLAWAEDAEFAQWVRENLPPMYNNIDSRPIGTYCSEQSGLFRNPIELGWEHMVDFNHEFIGRAALEKIAADPQRMVTTLCWNTDDVLDIFRSWLEPGEAYKFVDFPCNFMNMGPEGNDFQMDKVTTKDGKPVGLGTWYIYTPYYHKVISLGVIDIDQNEIGNELIMHWGGDGFPTKEIRVTVERFPYLDLTANKDFDMESIPRYGK